MSEHETAATQSALGRLGALALTPALLACASCFFLPFEQRTLAVEVQRAGPIIGTLLLVPFAVPLGLGLGTVFMSVTRREPPRWSLWLTTGVATLQNLTFCALFLLAIQNGHRDRDKMVAACGLVLAAAALRTLFRARKLVPWARWAHGLCSLVLAYVSLTVALFGEFEHGRVAPWAINMFLWATSMTLPIVGWILWPSRWRQPTP